MARRPVLGDDKATAPSAQSSGLPFRVRLMAVFAWAILALERMAPTLGPHTVCTVGQISCHPGARNVIPGEVRFSIDFRDVEGLDPKWSQVEPLVRAVASARHLAMELRPMRMPSGAVHDAQVMARLADTGMIFIPSRGGRSHCPEEYSAPAQVEQGVNVLLDAVITLAA